MNAPKTSMCDICSISIAVIINIHEAYKHSRYQLIISSLTKIINLKEKIFS